MLFNPPPHPLLRDGYSQLNDTRHSLALIFREKTVSKTELLGQVVRFLKSKPAHMSKVKSQKPTRNLRMIERLKSGYR